MLDTRPAWSFEPDATYVIAGGLGGLGRGIAHWMASRGAKYLLLLSRYGPRTQSASELLQELDALGVYVRAPPCDITSPVALKVVLDDIATTMPLIRGCIQGTMILRVRY